jgi:hypothetical protein
MISKSTCHQRAAFTRAMRTLIVLLVALLAAGGWDPSPTLARSSEGNQAASAPGPDDDEGGEAEGDDEDGDENPPNAKPKPDPKPKHDPKPKQDPKPKTDPKPKPDDDEPQPVDDTDESESDAKEEKGQARKRRRHEKRRERRHERRQRRREKRRARRHERRQPHRERRRERRRETRHGTRNRDAQRDRRVRDARDRSRSVSRKQRSDHPPKRASVRVASSPTSDEADETHRTSPKGKNSKQRRGSEVPGATDSHGGGEGDSATDEGLNDRGSVESSFFEALVQGGNDMEGSASVPLVGDEDDRAAQPAVPRVGTGLPLTGFQLLVMLSIGFTLILSGVVLYSRAIEHSVIEKASLWAVLKRSIQNLRRNPRGSSKRWRFDLRL